MPAIELWSANPKRPTKTLPDYPATSVHGKKKYAVGHMDQLLRKAAGPQQKLPIHALDRMLSFRS